MSLRYYAPQGWSHPYIRSFSILEESQAVFNKRIILPDSYPELIINLGSHLFWEMGNSTKIKLPRAFLVWAQIRPIKIYASGSCHVIGVNLDAWGLRLLVDEQIDLSKTPIIPLGDNWLGLPHLLQATIRSRGDIEVLATLEQFVSDYSPRASTDATIREVVELIYTTNGRRNVNELAAHCYLSVSQLERRFKYFTGLSPKTLARLVRFDHTCSGLLNATSSRLTDLAYEMGYFDQAHFNREFKAFTGRSPRQVRAYLSRLVADADFLQYS